MKHYSAALATEAHKLLGTVEARQERLVASFRLVVFGALLATVLSVSRTGAHFHPLLTATLAYGLLAVAGIWLAWRSLFRSWLLLAFVSIEVVLVGFQVVFLVPASGMVPAMVFGAPSVTIIFIILAHAAMRYRPRLILYAASLFLLTLFVGWIALDSGMGPTLSRMNANAHSHAIAHYQIIPIVAIGLTAAILYFANRGTRRLLESSIQNQLRVARLSRFFAAPIAEKLASDPGLPLMQGERRLVSILFIDIRGFTRLSEQLDPEAVGIMLADFRERVAKAVREEGGVIDKFVGDAVMAVFGLFDQDGGGSRLALDCAYRIDREMRDWSTSRARQELPQIKVGMGIHEGEAFVGVIGRAELLEFTVVGDTVNVAERLERMTRPLDAAIAISGEVFEAALSTSLGRYWSLQPHCAIPGRTRLLDVYYLPLSQSDNDRDVENVELGAVE